MNDSNSCQGLMDFLKIEEFHLPIDYDTLKNDFGYLDERDNFIESLGCLFDSYFKKLKTVRENELFVLDADDIEDCRKLRDSILDCLRNYYLGYSEKAYKTLKEILTSESIKECLDNLTTEISDLDDYFLFRIRMDEGIIEEYERALNVGKPIDWRPIFHVPFSKRRLIKNCRYSLAGVPCLYLASSIEVCHIETMTEASRDIFASYFKLKREGGEKLLNFSYTPQYLGTLLEDGREFKEIVKAYVVCYPLIASASVRVNEIYENRHFKPEYIIPQLLMQWLRREDEAYYGVKYFSTIKSKGDKELEDNRIRNLWNYAFPVREDEYDEGKEFSTVLKDFFEISNTVSFLNFVRSHIEYILSKFSEELGKTIRSCEDLNTEDLLKEKLENLSTRFVQNKCKFLENFLTDLGARKEIEKSICDLLRKLWEGVRKEDGFGEELIEAKMRKFLEENVYRTIDSKILKKDKWRKLNPVEQILIADFDDFIPDRIKKLSEELEKRAMWGVPIVIIRDMFRKYSNTLWGAFEGYLINQFEKSAQRDKY